mmetsp:Transcript_15741/g.23038  ORF Transcript_15741/g.23038 Transcript_15741/m.23038 type:complete len:87 (-) Transcript_15741:151-411(-)
MHCVRGLDFQAKVTAARCDAGGKTLTSGEREARSSAAEVSRPMSWILQASANFLVRSGQQQEQGLALPAATAAVAIPKLPASGLSM